MALMKLIVVSFVTYVKKLWNDHWNLIYSALYTCMDGWWKCPTTNDSKCIQNDEKCDGKNDCLDGADERNCGELISVLEFQFH